jgi:hypothetical protein
MGQIALLFHNNGKIKVEEDSNRKYTTITTMTTEYEYVGTKEVLIYREVPKKKKESRKS